MTILCSNETSERTSWVHVARLLAECARDNMVQLQPPSDRPSRLFSVDNRLGNEASPAGVCGVVAQGPDPLATPEKDSGSLPTDLSTGGSPTGTRLIVAPRPSRGTSDQTHATERLAVTTSVPTLVVHEPARILAWLRGKRSLRVLCADDLSTVADEALRFVRRLSKFGRCEIMLTHVHRSVEEVSHPGGVFVKSRRKHEFEMRSLLVGKLQERARTFLGDQPVTTHVSPAPFRCDDFILDVIRDTDADLVVTPIHPYAEAGTSHCTATSRTLLCFAEANLIIVPPPLVSAVMPKNVVRRVLVVAALTPTDVRVVSQASALLGSGGMLRVLHVLHPQAVPDTEDNRDSSIRQQVAAHIRLVESSSKHVRELAQNAANTSGITVESEVVENRDHAVAIADAAERFDADIVCLALAERPTFATRLFGSQMRRILTKARRSLLIVQPTPG